MTFRYRQGVKSGILIIITAFIVASATCVYGELSRSEETYKGLKLFSDVIEEIEKNYVEDVDTAKLIEKAINGMVDSLDPHSSFMPPEAYEDLQVETKGEFGGIGIVITQRDGQLTVISPIEGTPAYKAGVHAQDIIVKIDGKRTKDMMLWEAVKLMRGEPGTSVDITVYRQGDSDTLDFTLERAVIPLDSVRYLTLMPGYGYLWITNFRENTESEVKDALSALEKENAPLKGLIVDLRDNPGGLLDQAVKVSDIFLEDGKIVSIKGREADGESYSAHPNDKERNYPIVLLINGGSASAAEIVAGALQDNGRALVLGTTSFGKGSVQTVKPLRDGYALKYTIARYYTPSGRSIQAEGIDPDLVVKRRLLDESSGDGFDVNRIKEEDLQNHLMPEGQSPEKEKEEKSSEAGQKDDASEADKKIKADKEKEAQVRQLMRLRDAVYKHSDRDPSAILLDSQINRAYELLKGYQIFKQVLKN
ncbi:MAG TPA: S41 family peptidase [Desulfosalsimonadaceae bacterium]|nr:S41 family peptidase [Desulfosalsimonadaceae bacterium]